MKKYSERNYSLKNEGKETTTLVKMHLFLSKNRHNETVPWKFNFSSCLGESKMYDFIINTMYDYIINNTYTSVCMYYEKMKVKVAQLCPTLSDPMDYTVHGIFSRPGYWSG